ncbi:MAG: hypothetical protein ABI670_06175 [Chloroflexota bacterium]
MTRLYGDPQIVQGAMASVVNSCSYMTLSAVGVSVALLLPSPLLALPVFAAQADLIFVLDNGCLVEEGTHAELLQHGGLYASLYKEQMGKRDGAGRPR